MASPSLAARAAILGVPYQPNKRPDPLGVVKAIEALDAKAMATSAGAIVRDTLAGLNAVTNPPAHQMGWVTGDATVANNGIYENAGSPSAPNWQRRADLPFGTIHMINVGAGTPDAIVATSSLPAPSAPGAALFTINIIADNTGPVTINGKPLRTNSGNEIAPGGLIAGSIHAFLDLGDHFRLLSDQASAAVVGAAEAAAEQAIEAAETATEIADDVVQNYQFDWSGGDVANSPSLSVPAYIGRSLVQVGAFGSDADNAYNAIQKAITECSGGGKIMRFDKRNYLLPNASQMQFYIPSGTVVEGMEGNFIDASGAPLDPGLATTELSIIRCEGTRGTAYSLTSSASAGVFSVSLDSGDVSAMGLQRGDLVLISDDALFPSGSTYTDSAYSGETRTVYSASGGTINFFEPLESAYTTGNNAKVQKITPWKGKILGLNVRGRGLFEAADTGRGDTGIRTVITEDIEIAGNVVEDCMLMSYIVAAAFGGRVIGNVSRKQFQTGGKPSYGIGYYDGCQSLTIASNRCFGGSSGIVHAESGAPGVDRDILIEANFLEGNQQQASSHGIGSHTTAERITMRGNVIKGFHHGINCSFKHFTSEGNQIRGLGSGGAGINITERLEYFKSSGDTVEGGWYGIWMPSTDTQLGGTNGPIEITIEGFRGYNQNQYGVSIQYDDDTSAKKGLWIRNCLFRDVGGSGVRVSGSFDKAAVDNVEVDGSGAFACLNISGVTNLDVDNIRYGGDKTAPVLSGTGIRIGRIKPLEIATATPTLASQAQLALPLSGNVFYVTGNTQIRRMSNAAARLGETITLVFASNPVVTHNNSTSFTENDFNLAEGANYSAAANVRMTFISMAVGGGAAIWWEAGPRITPS